MNGATKVVLVIVELVIIGAAVWGFREVNHRAASAEQEKAQAAHDAALKSAAADVAQQQERVQLDKLRTEFAPKRAEVLAKADALLHSDPSKVLSLLSEFRGLHDPEVESYVRAAETRAAAHRAVQPEISGAELKMRGVQGAKLGMSAERVLQSSWGKPQRVGRTTTSAGVVEQWVYENGRYLYFANGVLTAIQE